MSLICQNCANEYNRIRIPHTLPCGHTICISCINQIVLLAFHINIQARCCPFCNKIFEKTIPNFSLINNSNKESIEKLDQFNLYF
jgi:hypothetical protein